MIPAVELSITMIESQHFLRSFSEMSISEGERGRNLQVDICLCHKDYNHCISNNDDGIIPEIDPNEEVGNINITASTLRALQKEQAAAASMASTTTTTEAPEIAEALGFDVRILS